MNEGILFNSHVLVAGWTYGGPYFMAADPHTGTAPVTCTPPAQTAAERWENAWMAPDKFRTLRHQFDFGDAPGFLVSDATSDSFTLRQPDEAGEAIHAAMARIHLELTRLAAENDDLAATEAYAAGHRPAAPAQITAPKPIPRAKPSISGLTAMAGDSRYQGLGFNGEA